MAVREKPWDIVFSSETGAMVRKRRLEPDGFEHRVGEEQIANGRRNVLPWGLLQDGDYFEVAVKGSEKAQRTGFKQAAARHDMEISVSRFDRDGVPMFRIIRVIGGISSIKAAARERGARAPSSDIRAYYRRQAARRRAVRLAATDIGPSPAQTLLGGSEAVPLAPPGTQAAALAARDAQIREARRRARMELAGLDPDEDEDIMGVGDD